jgi:hypothetical protein
MAYSKAKLKSTDKAKIYACELSRIISEAKENF